MKSRSRLLLAAAFVLVALVCLRLGFWQVSRLRDRRAANAVAAARRSAPPVTLQPGTPPDSALAGRRVRARGHYDHSQDVILRGRSYGGVPGVEVVSPLVLDAGRTAVLVNRGFVPAPDASTIDPLPLRESGEKEIAGVALPALSGGGAPLPRNRVTTWSRVDLSALRARLPYQLYPIVILQSPDSGLPNFPRRLEAPALDDGPHLSYAIQWFSFAAIALVFAGVFVRQDRSDRVSGREPGRRGPLQLIG